MLIYAKNGPKWHFLVTNCPIKVENHRIPTFFGSKKNDFGITKLIFGTKIRFWDIISKWTTLLHRTNISTFVSVCHG